MRPTTHRIGDLAPLDTMAKTDTTPDAPSAFERETDVLLQTIDRLKEKLAKAEAERDEAFLGRDRAIVRERAAAELERQFPELPDSHRPHLLDAIGARMYVHREGEDASYRVNGPDGFARFSKIDGQEDRPMGVAEFVSTLPEDEATSLFFEKPEDTGPPPEPVPFDPSDPGNPAFVRWAKYDPAGADKAVRDAMKYVGRR